VSFRSAAELAAHPDLMEPPAVLVPPIGVAGRVALLTLGPKEGKSTTAAGMVVQASKSGVKSGLITLDEALPDTLQRLERFDAVLEQVYLDDEWDATSLEEQVTLLGLQFLALDHLGKLAERHPEFGPGSQGDPLLWGRMVSPFTALAREHDVAVLLIDQARKSDGKYAGSVAKAGSVDILCELKPTIGGLAGEPKGRIALPPFCIELDAHGCPVFTGAEAASRKGRGDAIREADKLEVLAALQSAEPEGLRSAQWQTLARERTHIARSTFFEVRRSLCNEGFASYASRIYRVSPSGEKWLATVNENGKVHA
jgi:hypothetical protein